MIANLIQQHSDQIARIGLHLLWQGTAIAILATLAGRYLFKSPRQRSAIYLASLVALALCVPVTMIILTEPAAITQEVLVATQPTEFTGTQPAPSIEANSVALPEENSMPLTAWLVGLYFVGLALMLTRVIRGFLWSTKTRRQGSLVTQPEWTSALTQALAKIRLRGKPAMFWSENVTSPVVTGILRPMIVLPISLMSGLPHEQAIAVLSHELAHLRRFDHIIVVFQRLLEALLFFHPAVWFLSRRLDQEREKACDDLVLNTGNNRADYAEALVTIASEQKPSLALAAAGNKQLTERVLRILNHRQPTTVQVNRGGWLTIAAAITTLGFFSLSPAQSQEKKTDKEDEPVEEVKQTALMKKLQIKLPEMTLNNVTLTEALEFLRHRSIKLDPNPDPNKKGINLVARKIKPEKIIDNLVLRNVTFEEAFKAICLKTGTRYQVDEFFVAILPGKLEKPGKPDEAKPAGKIAEPAIMKKLQIKLPQMDLTNTTLEEAVEFLRLRSIELDPEPNPRKKGLNFVIRQPKDGEKINEQIIDKLKLKNVTYQQALQSICRKTETQFKVDEFAVTILPIQKDGNNELQLVQRRWAVPADFLRIITPENAEPKQADLVKYLRGRGIVFPEDATASHLAGSNLLIVRNTPNNLDLIDQLIQSIIAPKRVQKNVEDLKKIIIPKAIFENTTLQEAVDFMRLRALQLDPAKKGFNINIFGDKKLADTPINLHLQNVPLHVLLTYVCDITKTKFTIEGRSISIFPANK